jgi:D-alanyl-D-alanine carboxypeptidase
VTKSFTAAIVLDLVRRRKLKLDDAVSKYVPGWPNGRRITIRMLLNHSSGFTSWGNRNDPDDSQWSALVDPNLSRVLTVDESLAPTFRARKLLFRPGHGTNYSNANAQLAGLVAEKASGRSYGELVSALTKRLHLTGTALSYERPPGARPIMAGVFRLDPPGIDLDVSTVPQTAVQSFLGPAAGMVSTVHDLMAWAERDLRDGSFPTRALNREARRIDAGGAGLGLLGFGRHGYCIFDGCPKRERFTGVGFAGNGQGMAVRVVHDPRRDVTVLVFANSSKDVELDPEVGRILKLFPTD